MGKSLFEDLELGLSRPLSVLYLVRDIRIEFSKVDERRICAWRNDIWDAGVGETRILVRVVHGLADGGRGRGRRLAEEGGGKKERLEGRREMKYRRRKNTI